MKRAHTDEIRLALIERAIRRAELDRETVALWDPLSDDVWAKLDI